MDDIFTMVHEITIKRNKETDAAILGVIQSIAKENGVAEELVLNEKFITQAIVRSQKRKVLYERDFKCHKCPSCHVPVIAYTDNYCPKCGQALDWEV